MNKIILDEASKKGWIYLERFSEHPSNYSLKARISGHGYINLEKYYKSDEEAVQESKKIVSQLLGLLN